MFRSLCPMLNTDPQTTNWAVLCLASSSDKRCTQSFHVDGNGMNDEGDWEDVQEDGRSDRHSSHVWQRRVGKEE